MADLIRPIADDRGDAVALVDEHGTTTWSDLDERVNRAIDGLRAAGLRDGDTVAVLCGNRRELVEVTLAAMHASWVLVPVNWHWTADELTYVLDDSGAKVLIAEADMLDRADEAAGRSGHELVARVVVGDGGVDGWTPSEVLLAGASDAEPDGQASGGPMFYTSGTTGFPKGVRGTLSTIGQDMALWSLLADGGCRLLHLPEDGVALLDGPAYHSAQWAFSILPLVGARSTLVMREHFEPAATLRTIDEHAVTNLHLVPTQMNRLLRLPDEVRAGFDGSSLITVMHGAAPCPADVKRRLLDWWGDVVWEYYGGTEGGFLTVISPEEWRERPTSVGRTTALCEVAVFDESGGELPPGESGQIWFRSTTGSDFEYHGAPEKTAAAHRGDGWGTLGDVGWFDEERFLHLSDRLIDMVVSGGVNIYPAEIEAVLAQHPAVADVAVFGVPDEEFGEQVKAAVELVEGVVADDDLGAALDAHCREHLAGYKVPRSFDVHDSLPRMPTGKLAKRSLRDPWWEGTGRKI
jgi:long-chain acyl-CoA synthetase